MFTGLVEEVGRITEIEQLAAGSRLSIAASFASEMTTGESIAVNGVCLTAIDIASQTFAAELSPETLARTTLGSLSIGAKVNLERAMLPTTRFGGHIVQGHVDGRGTFIKAEPEGDFWTVSIGFPRELGRYFIEKGSVAVEGISLTIARLEADYFDIAVIPKTWEITNLSSLKKDDHVNLEADVIAKYVERMILHADPQHMKANVDPR
jgi:riboflavin synthase